MNNHDCSKQAIKRIVNTGAADTSTTKSHRSTRSEETNTGRMIAGAILLATGAVLSITGLGMIIGIPLGLLGFGLMFPRFTMAMVLLSVVSFVVLLLILFYCHQTEYNLNQIR